MQERNNGGHLSKVEMVKAQFAKTAVELTPYFANFGLTENALVAAGIMVASGAPVVPALIALGLTKSYYLNKAVAHYRAKGSSIS